MTTDYKNYEIIEVFRRHIGNSDFVVREKDADYGVPYPKTNLMDVKRSIDEIIEDKNPE